MHFLVLGTFSSNWTAQPSVWFHKGYSHYSDEMSMLKKKKKKK